MENIMDIRWPTSDTEFAACLATHGFELVARQPVTVEQITGKEKATFHFRGTATLHGENLRAIDLQTQWAEARAPGQDAEIRASVLLCRRAAKSRSIIFARCFRGVPNIQNVKDGMFVVHRPNAVDAVMLFALGQDIVGFDADRIWFQPQAKLVHVAAMNSISNGEDCEAHWFRTYADNYGRMVSFIRTRENIPLREHRIPENRKGFATVSSKAPDDLIRMISHQLAT